jgi:hypothetical protein
MTRFFLLFVVVSWFCASPIFADIQRTSTPHEAVYLANADLDEVERTCSLFGIAYEPSRFRYVWVQDGSASSLATVSFTLNSVISRSDINYPPNKGDSPISYRANGLLVRVDLQRLCPDDEDFKEVAELWEKIPNPFFMFLQSDRDLKQIFGPHIDLDLGTRLQALTDSTNPIVAAPSLHIAALTQADGGLYYAFRDVPKASDKQRENGKSDFDVLLKGFGVNEERIRELGVDQWTGQRISNVTGKPRRIVFFNRPAPTGKIQGWISITYDTLDDNTSVDAHPLLSLLEFEHDGTEVIIEQNNGHLLYLLYDGNGNLVDEAPPNLVSDPLIPNPHTKRLQPAISCIRCHGGEAEQGWKSFPNDVQRLVNITGMDIAADETANGLGLDHEQAMELLARLYSNDMSKPLRRAREDQQEAVMIATHGAVNKEGLPWRYNDAASALTQVFERYHYDPVGPIEACRDLGYQVTDLQEATDLFRLLMGVGNGQVFGVSGFATEDFRIGAIKAGERIVRRDWNAVLVDAANRARINEEFIQNEVSK